MTLATAGHVDHGKSALVEALTGVHPDRLAEEQRRGMTLDLGFGHWRGADGGERSIVDVPGHERFIHTMLAGAGGVDAVLLVVAADAGVQPQTIEHFEICRLLGMTRGVVAMTKCDLAGPEQRAAVREQVAKRVRGSFLENAAVIEVSARSGEGMAELRRALEALPAAARDADAPFRLPVDRGFSMPGFGAVVTGTLLSGRIRAGAEAVLEPGGLRARIRGVQVHGVSVEAAQAGERTAVNLAGVEVAALARGQSLCEPGAFAASKQWDAVLELLPGTPLHPRARMQVHLHAASAPATLVWIETPRFAQLRLAAPLCAVAGDRFILRQLSPPMTLGGGRVLEPDAPRHRQTEREGAAKHLAALAAADAARGVALRLERAGAAGMPLAALSAALGRSRAQLQPVLEAAGAHVAEEEVISAPALAGIEQALLAGAVPAGTPPRWLKLAAQRLRAAGRAPAAAEPDAAAIALRAAIEARLRELGLAAPPLVEFLTAFPQAAARGQVAVLARERRLIECQPGWYLHAEAIAALRSELARRKPGSQTFSVGEFKLWTGLTRKSAIPLLEFLDRQRVTRRSGDQREIL